MRFPVWTAAVLQTTAMIRILLPLLRQGNTSVDVGEDTSEPDRSDDVDESGAGSTSIDLGESSGGSSGSNSGSGSGSASTSGSSGSSSSSSGSSGSASASGSSGGSSSSTTVRSSGSSGSSGAYAGTTSGSHTLDETPKTGDGSLDPMLFLIFGLVFVGCGLVIVGKRQGV